MLSDTLEQIILAADRHDMPYKYLKRIKMDLSEWYEVADNPRQRDTERHAARADHLRQYSPEHQVVKMAVLPGGDAYKLDGHTRAYLWATGEVQPPFDHLMVDVFLCNSIDAVKNLYGHFDNKGAVETGVDLVLGAMREADLKFTSKAMQSGRFGTALRLAYSTVKSAHFLSRNDNEEWRNPLTIYDAALYFRDELFQLDDLDILPRLFPSGITMGALLTLKRKDFNAIDFWLSYRTEGGVKDKSGFDSIYGLFEVTKRMPKNGRTNCTSMAYAAIGAVEGWRSGKIYENGGPGVRALAETTVAIYLRKLPKPILKEQDQ